MRRIATALILVGCLAWAGLSSGGTGQAIPEAYRTHAGRVAIPPAVLYTLALLESGQSTKTADYRPWPWTLTVDHKPFYFDSRAAALSALLAAVVENPDQLGIGLYQIEHRWHHQRFADVSQMLDPYHNAQVAAAILAEYIRQEDGDLWRGIGRFHSSTPHYALAYQLRFAAKLLDVLGAG